MPADKSKRIPTPLLQPKVQGFPCTTVRGSGYAPLRGDGKTPPRIRHRWLIVRVSVVKSQ